MQCLQEVAEEEGDAEKSKTLSDKLTELEERADLLDKQRTKGLSAIRYWLAVLANTYRVLFYVRIILSNTATLTRGTDTEMSLEQRQHSRFVGDVLFFC